MRLTMLVLAVATTALAQRPDSMTLWEWEDASGLHQVERRQDVPKKYRSKAREVSVSVIVGPSGRGTKSPGREGPDARGPSDGGVVAPALAQGSAPALDRYYCRWQASVRPTPKACRTDGDCGGGVCVNGACVKSGTREPSPASEVGGKQRHGCYADSAELKVVKRACERDGRAKSGEDITCTCFSSPLAVDEECR